MGLRVCSLLGLSLLHTTGQVLLNKEMIAVNQDKLGSAGGRMGYSKCEEVSCKCSCYGNSIGHMYYSGVEACPAGPVATRANI